MCRMEGDGTFAQPPMVVFGIYNFREVASLMVTEVNAVARVTLYRTSGLLYDAIDGECLKCPCIWCPRRLELELTCPDGWGRPPVV